MGKEPSLIQTPWVDVSGYLAHIEEDNDFLTFSNKVQEGLVSGPSKEKHHFNQG